MRTIFFEEVMLKTRQQEVMKEYKSVQPRRHKSPEYPFGQFHFRKIIQKTWVSFVQLLHNHGDEPEFEPADS